MTVRRWLAAGLLVPVLGACGSTPDPPGQEPEPAESEVEADETEAAETEAAEPVVPGETITVDLADRPFRLHVPESYDPAGSVPLVLLLHGYTASASVQELYFQLTAESDRRGFLYAMPDGTTDPSGDRFWNATDACCDFHRTGVDDAAYLRQIIDELVSSYPVDADRVYLVGHSNGGFMAHRMACEHAPAVRAIVSLAGMPPHDASDCTPEQPVSVLQIHGTADTTIPFEGGANLGHPFPSAAETVQLWRDRNGCADQADASAPPLDLDSSVEEAETTVTAYARGCDDRTRVELWSIQDGGHVPSLTSDFAPAVVEFLYSS